MAAVRRKCRSFVPVTGLFLTILSQMEVFTTSRNGFQKTRSSYNLARVDIFERFQTICMFSTIVSQMEAFTTSKIGFQKTRSS